MWVCRFTYYAVLCVWNFFWHPFLLLLQVDFSRISCTASPLQWPAILLTSCWSGSCSSLRSRWVHVEHETLKWCVFVQLSCLWKTPALAWCQLSDKQTTPRMDRVYSCARERVEESVGRLQKLAQALDNYTPDSVTPDILTNLQISEISYKG